MNDENNFKHLYISGRFAECTYKKAHQGCIKNEELNNKIILSLKRRGVFQNLGINEEILNTPKKPFKCFILILIKYFVNKCRVINITNINVEDYITDDGQHVDFDKINQRDFFMQDRLDVLGPHIADFLSNGNFTERLRNMFRDYENVTKETVMQYVQDYWQFKQPGEPDITNVVNDIVPPPPVVQVEDEEVHEEPREELPPPPPPVVPVPPEVPPEEVMPPQFHTIWDNTKQLYMDSHFFCLAHNDEFKTQLENIQDVRQKKVLIYWIILLTYFISPDNRTYVGKLIKTSLERCITPQFSLSTYNTEILVFVRDASRNKADYFQNVESIMNEIVVKINETRFDDEFVKQIEKLPKCIGFKYGIKGLTFNIEAALSTYINQGGCCSCKRKVFPQKKGLERIISAHFELSVPWTIAVDKIAFSSPFIVKNAKTLFMQEPLVEINPKFYTRIDNFGFDISDIILNTLTSQGDNKINIGQDTVLFWAPSTKLVFLNSIKNYIYNGNGDEFDEKITQYTDYAEGLLSEHGNNITEIFDTLKNKVTPLWYFISRQHSLESYIPQNLNELQKKKYLCLLASIYFMIRSEATELGRNKILLHDMNILHLIGLIGFILKNDNITAGNNVQNGFDVSTNCLAVLKQYFLTEDTVNVERYKEQYYYLQAFHGEENPDNFSKKRIVKEIKGLSLSGYKIEQIINDPSCIHGVGQRLMKLYLTTLHKLNDAIELGIITKEEIPFYSQDNLKPLACFKNIGGEQYLYLTKYWTEQNANCIFDNTIATYDGMMKSNSGYGKYVRVYLADVINISKDIERCCDVKLYCDQANDNIDNILRYRVFTKQELVTSYFQASPNTMHKVKDTLTTDASRCDLIRSCDLFNEHRTEHFNIFARYVIDFSNMIQQHFESGLLTFTVVQPTSDQEQIKYIVNTNFDENLSSVNWKDDIYKLNIDQFQTIEDVMMYIYQLSFSVSSKEDLKDEISGKYTKSMNVNTYDGVIRNFKDSVTDSTSKMVYLYDYFAKNMTDIYDKDVHSGTVKCLLGIQAKQLPNVFMNKLVERTITNLGEDAMDEQKNVIKQDLQPYGEEDNVKNFNKLIVKKCLMSEVIMKYLNKNYLNPFYIFNTRSEDDILNDSIINYIKKSYIDKIYNYLNLSSGLDATAVEPLYTVINKYQKAMICHGLYFYLFMYSITPLSLEPWGNGVYRLYVKERSKILGGLNSIELARQTGFTSMYIDLAKPEHEDDVTLKNRCIEGIKTLKNSIVDILFNFMSILFNSNNAATFDYHAASLYKFHHILEIFDKKYNSAEGRDINTKAMNLYNDPEIQNVLKFYTENRKPFFDAPDIPDISNHGNLYNMKHYAEKMMSMCWVLYGIEGSVQAQTDNINKSCIDKILGEDKAKTIDEVILNLDENIVSVIENIIQERANNGQDLDVDLIMVQIKSIYTDLSEEVDKTINRYVTLICMVEEIIQTVIDSGMHVNIDIIVDQIVAKYPQLTVVLKDNVVKNTSFMYNRLLTSNGSMSSKMYSMAILNLVMYNVIPLLM
jgi:hypothetical protein